MDNLNAILIESADAKLNNLLEELPSDIANSLSAKQLGVLAELMAKHQGWGRKHRVDLRMRFGLGGSRFYTVLLAGPEARPYDRRSYETSRVEQWLTMLILAGLVVLQAIAWRYMF